MEQKLLIGRFDQEYLNDATELLRAVAHPIRLAVVDLLRETQSLSVSDIHEKLNIEQAVASHHLRILKDKKIVKSRRDGKNIYYSLRTNALGNFIDILEEVLPQ